jgi:hypothetical protein
MNTTFETCSGSSYSMTAHQSSSIQKIEKVRESIEVVSNCAPRPVVFYFSTTDCCWFSPRLPVVSSISRSRTSKQLSPKKAFKNSLNHIFHLSVLLFSLVLFNFIKIIRYVVLLVG